MGRTKRLRQNKRKNMTSNKCSAAICLYDYMAQFRWNNHNKLICHEFLTTGRGLCSKTGISTGDVLIKLPLGSMITLVTLENDIVFRNIIEECEIPLKTITFQSLLALYILYQKHLDNDVSRLKLYISTIPKTFSTPYFCEKNELYFLPETILQLTVEQNKRVRDSYSTFQDAFCSRVCPCCMKSYIPEIFTLSDFKWAYFAVNSRSVFVSASKIQSLITGESFYKQILSDEPDMALAPFLDLFNHSDIANTEAGIVIENNELSFQLITNDSYKPYEQVYISYGNLTNLKLLTDYGFSLRQNLHDYFEISLADIEALIKSDCTFKNSVFHSNKFKYIRNHNLNDQMFIHAVDGMSHNLQVTLYLIFKETSHFNNVLNHTAFGTNIISEDSIQKEAKQLTLFKIKEYQALIEGFSKLYHLSVSATATVQYMKHSILYLQAYLDNFFLES